MSCEKNQNSYKAMPSILETNLGQADSTRVIC